MAAAPPSPPRSSVFLRSFGDWAPLLLGVIVILALALGIFDKYVLGNGRFAPTPVHAVETTVTPVSPPTPAPASVSGRVGSLRVVASRQLPHPARCPEDRHELCFERTRAYFTTSKARSESWMASPQRASARWLSAGHGRCRSRKPAGWPMRPDWHQRSRLSRDGPGRYRLLTKHAQCGAFDINDASWRR